MSPLDRNSLPIRQSRFQGVANRTLEGSQPDWNMIGHVEAPDGAPNVLLVLIDDAGFGNPSTFGGPIDTPNYTRTAEEGLAAEHALLRDLVDGMPAVPWTHTVDAGSGWARYVFMGAQANELVGYTSEELVAEPYHFPRLVHPDDREHVARVNEASDRTGVWDDEYRLIHRGCTALTAALAVALAPALTRQSAAQGYQNVQKAERGKLRIESPAKTVSPSPLSTLNSQLSTPLTRGAARRGAGCRRRRCNR